MIDEDDDPAGRGWHLDRRIPVALILSLLVYFVVVTVWIVGISNKTDSNTKALSQLYDRLEKTEDAYHDLDKTVVELRGLVRELKVLLELERLQKKTDLQRRRKF